MSKLILILCAMFLIGCSQSQNKVGKNIIKSANFINGIQNTTSEGLKEKAIWALENSNGVINYAIDENTNFSLFISRYDYFDGRFSQKVGNHLIITNLYCDFDALDNSKTSF